MKKVSIIDVAKHAGVSVSTVSLVLRQKGKISEATIGKVNAAITTLAQNPAIASIITTHVIPAQRAVDAFAVAKDSQVSGKVVVSLWLDE